MADDNHSIVMGSLYMVVLSILLGWIPVLGPFFAGFIGGRKAGSPGAGVMAAILPALVVAGIVALIVLALEGMFAWLAAIFGAALLVWILVQSVAVILGGLVGGFTAQRGSIGTISAS